MTKIAKLARLLAIVLLTKIAKITKSFHKTTVLSYGHKVLVLVRKLPRYGKDPISILRSPFEGSFHKGPYRIPIAAQNEVLNPLKGFIGFRV